MEMVMKWDMGPEDKRGPQAGWASPCKLLPVREPFSPHFYWVTSHIQANYKETFPSKLGGCWCLWSSDRLFPGRRTSNAVSSACAGIMPSWLQHLPTDASRELTSADIDRYWSSWRFFLCLWKTDPAETATQIQKETPAYAHNRSLLFRSGAHISCAIKKKYIKWYNLNICFVVIVGSSFGSYFTSNYKKKQCTLFTSALDQIQFTLKGLFHMRILHIYQKRWC